MQAWEVMLMERRRFLVQGLASAATLSGIGLGLSQLRNESPFAPAERSGNSSPTFDILKGDAVAEARERFLRRRPAVRLAHEGHAAEMRARGYVPRPDLARLWRQRPSDKPSQVSRVLSFFAPTLQAQNDGDGAGDFVDASPYDTGDETQFAAQLTAWNEAYACTANGNAIIDITTGNVIVGWGTAWDSEGTEIASAWMPTLRGWSACVVSACSAGLGVCAQNSPGPGWLDCVIGYCGGNEVSCTAIALIQAIRRGGGFGRGDRCRLRGGDYC